MFQRPGCLSCEPGKSRAGIRLGQGLAAAWWGSQSSFFFGLLCFAQFKSNFVLGHDFCRVVCLEFSVPLFPGGSYVGVLCLEVGQVPVLLCSSRCPATPAIFHLFLTLRIGI